MMASLSPAEFAKWRERRCKRSIVVWGVLFVGSAALTLVAISTSITGAASIAGAVMALVGWRLFDAIHTDNLRRKYG